MHVAMHFQITVKSHLGEERGGVKSTIHFHCVLHAKRGGGLQVACKIVYVLNRRPLNGDSPGEQNKHLLPSGSEQHEVFLFGSI